MILEKITASADVKRLTDEQLSQLAKEIREFLISHVSETGGHLAANLGVVELTLALHQVFDVEYDRIVWDVGHQAYVHKILTGRWGQFATLRQMDGLSGFPKAEESNTDAFNTGHSSTSISAAVGFATVAKLCGEERSAVAVIGDGSLTGGMAFEAMNHAGAIKTPVIVVLNDNGMSISKNVGGLSKRLRTWRNTKRYFNFKSNVKSVLDRIPLIGKPMKRLLKVMKRWMKQLFVQGVLFEDLGFRYLGPVDGHNVEQLKVIFEQAKNMKEPVVIHVRTKKGKGYSLAEKNPEFFHGVPSFDSQTGQPLKRMNQQDWSELFGDILVELAEKNPKILAITAAMPLGTGLNKFRERFRNRYFNVGIAEQHAVTFAASLAKAGMIPCFAVYSTFLQRGYDQLLHDVALQNLHVVFCVDRCGPVGADGETHQGVFDISYLTQLPGFTVLSPSNAEDFRKMLAYAFEECTGPVAIRYPRGEVHYSLWHDETLPITVPCLRREGTDVLITAVGTTVYDAIEAAEILSTKDVSVGVLEVRAVKPLDFAILQQHSVGKKLLVSLEDNVSAGGFGQQLMAGLQEKVMILAYPEEPIPQGTVSQIKEKYGLSSMGIAERILEELGKN